MKNIYLILLLVLLGTSCRTSKVVSQQTTTDSTTTVAHRIVPVKIKPATLTDSVNLYTFTHTFDKAAVGAVIRQKKGKRVSYSIRKTSTTDFDVEAVAEKVDTAVTVTETTTVVHQKERVIVEQSPTMFGKLWQTSKDAILLSGLLLLVVLLVVNRLTK